MNKIHANGRKTIVTQRKYPTEVIAHRGFSACAPENTLEAFRLAIASSADRVEFDVLLTRDGVPVVIHDALLDRTTNGHGPVADLNLADLRALDAGSWFEGRFAGERVPTLEETLALCAGRIPVNVEIKEESVMRGVGTQGGIEAQVVSSLAWHGLLGSATVSSFDPLALERVRRLAPLATCEVLFSDPDRGPSRVDLVNARRAGFGGLNLGRDELWRWPGIVVAAHALGLRVKVYTVDEAVEMVKLLELGVDGIFTNRPDVLASIVGALE